MKSIGLILLGLSITALAGCRPNPVSTPNLQSSWVGKFDSEATQERLTNEICQTLPKVWVLKVDESEKALALDQLRSKPWIELSLEETKAMTTIALDTNNYPPKTQESLAGDLLWQAVKNASKESESRSFDYCTDAAGQECSDYLTQLGLQGVQRGRTPFLIRSAWQNPGTGRYYVQECESGVTIQHSSLSRTSSDPENNPLIIFLKRPPRDVFIYTDVAE